MVDLGGQWREISDVFSLQSKQKVFAIIVPLTGFSRCGGVWPSLVARLD